MLIQVEELTKTYVVGTEEVHALDHVSFNVGEGEFVSIMGASGSGKSTLMNLLGCLDTPTEGRYLLKETDVSKMNDEELAVVRNREIGFVFQVFNLLPGLTALHNVEVPLIYNRVPRKKRLEMSLAMLKAMGMGERAHHRPNQLSGGQRQRVAVARALVNSPSLILADEPTGNLDSKTTLELMELIRELNRKGNTIILVTHEPDIGAMANRTITLKDGKIIEDINHVH
ncbi:MAG: macrolide ABC transporter ATP-binding protein [Acidobacteria bacterium]|nr:MAG: macrolide ABC transporter ATP-binding protein [Acidobacteriota bacterium]RLE22635.1 MAG: macrolide ABC transporter ATP-binding protein [Acidobacteriota bacterium]